MSNVIKNRLRLRLPVRLHRRNPNGDPDAANAPRLDPQTMQASYPDVPSNGKIRTYIYLAKAQPDGEDLDSVRRLRPATSSRGLC